MLYKINTFGGKPNTITVLSPGLTGVSRLDPLPTNVPESGDFSNLDDRFVAGYAQDLTLNSFDMGGATAYTAASGLRNHSKVHNFDGSSSEYATFIGKTPADYSSRPVDIVVNWTGNEEGTVLWSAAIDSYGSASIDSDNFGAECYGSGTIATSGQIVNTSIPMTSSAMQSLSRNDTYAIRITRHPASGQDNLSTDASLVYFDVREGYIN